MTVRLVQRFLVAAAFVTTASFAFASPVAAQPGPAPRQGVRTVNYHARDLVSVRAKVHFTTLIVLPDGQDVIEATCGDKEQWIVNVRGALVSVKPAKPGSESNLNLVTTTGQVYTFVLTEVSEQKGSEPDLAVYLEPDELDARPLSSARPRFVPAEQVEDYRLQADVAREQARRATDAANQATASARRDADAAIGAFRTAYPTTLKFPYWFKADAKPFFVRAIFHDDRRTFIRMDARELPALYEIKDRLPNLVNFDVHGDTYIVPKVLDSGYLMVGKARLEFRRLEGK